MELVLSLCQRWAFPLPSAQSRLALRFFYNLGVATETLLKRAIPELGEVEVTIQFDATTFGVSPTAITPWTIAVQADGRDIGRLVGFEGEGQRIIAMHGLKPDPTAKRGVEITVFRVSEAMRASQLDVAVISAFERWLLKQGWRGNILKRLKFTAADQVIPIRTFWVQQGFELVLAQPNQWDEHVIKRWR